MYFWVILRVAVFSYPVGGQVFPKSRSGLGQGWVGPAGIAL